MYHSKTIFYQDKLQLFLFLKILDKEDNYFRIVADKNAYLAYHTQDLIVYFQKSTENKLSSNIAWLQHFKKHRDNYQIIKKG